MSMCSSRLLINDISTNEASELTWQHCVNFSKSWTSLKVEHVQQGPVLRVAELQ